MSQIAAAGPLRTAKYIAKQKEIHHVKSAIRWHERQREQRKTAGRDAFETKQTALSHIKWDVEHVDKPKKKALMQARTDWKLGPLRPNRAVGDEVKTYGALGQDDMRQPSIPVGVQKRRNEFLEKAGREHESPLVVDDKKYFHIVRDDRVVILRGREAMKIGVVREIIADSHEVVVQDINKAYADSSIFNNPSDGPQAPKRETEATVPIDHVRLVIPYRITSASGRETFQDVIVDKVIMERHTTGIDPFTGIDYGNEEFPVEHRYDPKTELPVFNRYIAGTRSLIQWPYELDDEKLVKMKEGERKAEIGPTELERMRTRDKILSPIKTVKLKLKEKQQKQEDEAKVKAELSKRDVNELDSLNADLHSTVRSSANSQPLEKAPDYDDDTGRNKADPDEQASRTFYPTLVYPPFPDSLPEELAPHIREVKWKEAKEKRENDTEDVLQRKKLERELAKNEEKMKALEVMKTPLQLRWELQRAQQLKEKKEVDMDQLLAALGKHMVDNGVGVNGKRSKKAGKVEEPMADIE